MTQFGFYSPSELVKCPPGLIAPKATLTCSKTGKKESCSLTCASKAHYLAGMLTANKKAIKPSRLINIKISLSFVCLSAESDNSYSVSCGIPILRGKSPARLNSSSSQSCIGATLQIVLHKQFSAGQTAQ